MIRTMTIQDIDEVVSIHLASFQGFFLSFLGPRFLNLYYAGVSSDHGGICIVYLNEAGRPAGFVAGSCNPRGFYSRLLKRDWLRFSLAATGAVLRKPGIVSRLFRALFHPSENPESEDVAGLFSLGVLPVLQGKGAGKELVQAFLSEASTRGCTRVFLTTDRDNNEAVNKFYSRLGFRVERVFETPDGRRMNEYWIDI